jgi:hypothetical protein
VNRLSTRTRAFWLLVAGVLALAAGSATAANDKPTKPDNHQVLGLTDEGSGPGAPTKEKANKSNGDHVTMHILRDGKYVEIDVPVRKVKTVDPTTGNLVDEPTLAPEDVQAERTRRASRRSSRARRCAHSGRRRAPPDDDQPHAAAEPLNSAAACDNIIL